VSDTITVTAVLNGQTITFTGRSSPAKDISISGGSNWDITAVSSAGGNCSLTPTNFGAFCSYATAVTSFTITTTISGTPPTAVAGQVGYADSSTGTFTAPVSTAPLECHCTKVRAAFIDFKSERHGYVLAFALRWKLYCDTGSTGGCDGTVDLHRPEGLPHGARLRMTEDGKFESVQDGVTIICRGPCKPTRTGEEKFELISHSDLRANKKIVFPFELFCSTHQDETTEDLILKFDGHGRLEPPPASHLGKLS
jgi:hypothetical protein